MPRSPDERSADARFTRHALAEVTTQAFSTCLDVSRSFAFALACLRIRVRTTRRPKNRTHLGPRHSALRSFCGRFRGPSPAGWRLPECGCTSGDPGLHFAPASRS
jgi:hypothetical protein